MVELVFVYFAGGFRHQIYRLRGFAEGDHFANGFFSGKEHHYAIEAESDAAVWRRAVGERVHKKAEAAPQLFLRKGPAL